MRNFLFVNAIVRTLYCCKTRLTFSPFVARVYPPTINSRLDVGNTQNKVIIAQIIDSFSPCPCVILFIPLPLSVFHRSC